MSLPDNPLQAAVERRVSATYTKGYGDGMRAVEADAEQLLGVMHAALQVLGHRTHVAPEVSKARDLLRNALHNHTSRKSAPEQPNPNPSGHVPAEASLSPEASGPVGLGPHAELTVKLRGLLGAARCPNNACDGKGTIWDGVDPEQCEWCFERDAALKEDIPRVVLQHDEFARWMVDNLIAEGYPPGADEPESRQCAMCNARNPLTGEFTHWGDCLVGRAQAALNSTPEEGRSLSKPHPSDVCGWCGFRFGKHSVVGDACPLPPASEEGSWTWDSRTFKPEVAASGAPLQPNDRS